MPEYKYLIVGGGMTADVAVSGVSEVDAHGKIGIITAPGGWASDGVGSEASMH